MLARVLLGSWLAACVGILLAQTAPAFDVASVKASEKIVGPDYNNQIRLLPDGFGGRNVTLRRLVAWAWHVQSSQVIGTAWMKQTEYDIDAKAAGATPTGQMERMLQTLLRERFGLRQHDETRDARVYELAVVDGGARIHPVEDGAAPARGTGIHFHGDMHDLADLVGTQLTIPAPVDPAKPVIASEEPVITLDKTGLQGTYDFFVKIVPEAGSDGFAFWQRGLRDLGLTIRRSSDQVHMIVIDWANKVPLAN